VVIEGHWDVGFRRMALFSSSIARRRGFSVLDIIFEYLNEYSLNIYSTSWTSDLGWLK
jgi:hypothetical protein